MSPLTFQIRVLFLLSFLRVFFFFFANSTSDCDLILQLETITKSSHLSTAKKIFRNKKLISISDINVSNLSTIDALFEQKKYYFFTILNDNCKIKNKKVFFFGDGSIVVDLAVA